MKGPEPVAFALSMICVVAGFVCLHYGFSKMAYAWFMTGGMGVLHSFLIKH